MLHILRTSSSMEICDVAGEIIGREVPEWNQASPTSREDREKWGILDGEEFALLERLDGGGFVVFHVENGVELSDLEQIVDLLGEVQQFEFAALILGGGEGADQFADA